MDFALSDDQLTFIDQVDRYLRDTCPPDRLHKAFDGNEAIASEIFQGLLELGLGGLVAPEEHGGLGLGLLEAASITERIGFAGAPGPWVSHVLAVLAIANAGSDAQKARWLPGMAAGEIVGAVALMEGSAWSPEDWKLSASPRLSGAKDYVMGLREAQVFVVGLAGGQLALVESTAPGVSMTPWFSTDMTRPVGQIGFDNVACEVMPQAYGAELLDAALTLASADSHGASARMVEDIVEYSKTRVQFDRPIAAFQAVKHKLADLATAVEPNGPLYRQTAAIFDQTPDDSHRAAALAKAHITEVASNICRIATESYGGIGYTWEHSAHIWLRRAMFNYAWMGTPAVHRARAADLAGW